MRPFSAMKLVTGVFVLLIAAVTLSAQEGGDVWSQIDDLNDAKQFDEAFALLSTMEAENATDVAYLWRLARHYFNVSDNTDVEEAIGEALYAGLKVAETALAADSTSAFAHGYYGILIGRVGEFEGTKQKIINSYAVRDHTMQAIALDPNYDAWQHVMGQWHYKLSDLSWIERTVASIIYETPPKASFEEAERYFAAASRIDPNEIRHLVWLGKSQLELDKDSAAKASFEAALSLTALSDSDRMLQDEARELLD